jgi:phosphate transport system permease protein
MTEPRKRRRRLRTNRRGVKLADRLSRAVITVGGLGTIAAVSLLCLFLVWVVVPLFQAPTITERARGPGSQADVLALGSEEYTSCGWTCSASGEIRAFDLASGAELARVSPLEGAVPSAVRVSSADRSLAFGFADGSVRIGSLDFPARYLAPDDVPPEARALPSGARLALGAGMIEHTQAGPFRRLELAVHLAPPTMVASGRALRLLDLVETTSGPVLASVADDDVLRVSRVTRQTNLMTGEERLELENGELTLDFSAQGGPPEWLGVTGLGDNVYLSWADGTLWRCDVHELASLRVVEKRDLLGPDELRTSAREFLLGRTALLLGDSSGGLGVWFASRRDDAGTPDGMELVLAHEFPGHGPALTALARSARKRMLAAGYADGTLRLFHSTSERELLVTRLPGPATPVTLLAIAPKDDALLAGGSASRAVWSLDAPHTETSVAALFAPVWYESFSEPEHFWQTTGDDEFEPKFGLVPLVFGTLKATFYSLLFGVPIALLAAVYTSEFLSTGQKARIKPTIEMMASLPSVVLGFLSALVLAPLIEDVVPGVLLSTALLPFMVLLGGHLWGTLPGELGARLARYRLLFVALCLGLGLAAGAVLGPRFEGLFFGGDFRQWLAGGAGGGTGGWMILLLPLAVTLVWLFVANRVDPALARAYRERSRASFARACLAKFLLGAGVCLLLLLGASALLAASGLDPRGGLLDTYQQRNSLVVGFVMGFAIIPIVYTIAEDALAAVPDHLRAASLGAGATPWQTAVRIVLPTAMSGIFSAVMIGFGRAVGETMIVLMAAGSTPVLEWNVFNGFRTLSANVASEMPEAVRGSTHYRMLFLSALVLFALTSVLNTGAELVRLRYRRRRVQL